MADSTRHLELLELDAARAGEALPAAAAAHAAWCAQCRAALAELHDLAAALRAPAGGAPPADRDAVILAAARGEAARVRRARALPAALAAAAVAVLALAGLLLTPAPRPDGDVAGVAHAPAARLAMHASAVDRDGDGRVTVLDAFALARADAHGTPQLDDEARVDAIMAMAVSLRSR